MSMADRHHGNMVCISRLHFFSVLGRALKQNIKRQRILPLQYREVCWHSE